MNSLLLPLTALLTNTRSQITAALFDGHGGDLSALWLQKELFAAVTARLDCIVPPGGDVSSVESSVSDDEDAFDE